MSNPAAPYEGKYRISKKYGTPPPAGMTYSAGNHPGIDLVGMGQKTIFSIMPGTVHRCGYDADGWGNYVVVKQTDGFYAIYAHLATKYVSSGQVVRIGERLGVEGATGKVTGRHLHLEIRGVYTNKYSTINPAKYLKIKDKVGEVEREMADISKIKIQIPDGNVLSVDGIMQENVNYASVRQLMEAMGYSVSWQDGKIIVGGGKK